MINLYYVIGSIELMDFHNVKLVAQSDIQYLFTASDDISGKDYDIVVFESGEMKCRKSGTETWSDLDYAY